MFNFGFIKREKLRDRPVRPLLPTFLVFLALMVIIGMSWRTAKLDINNQQNNTVQQDALFIETSLIQRFGVYEDSLHAANGLFTSSENVTRDEWNAFVDSMKIPVRYPGIRALGYVKLVSGESKNSFEESVRSEGLINYSVHPAGERDTYALLYYLVPFIGRKDSQLTAATLGFDLYSDSDRKMAMLDSAKIGGAVLSKQIKLLPINDDEAGEGFIMFMPHYKKNFPISTPQERIGAIDGYFYAPFKSSGVFSALFSTSYPSFAFALYQGEPSTGMQLYKSGDNFNDNDFQVVKRTNLTMYGQNWSIIYKIRQDIVPATVRSRPNSVLIAGTIFALALAAIIYLLIQRRTRSLRYDEQRKLEEAKDDLLSLASHQLRTPATAVKQYVSMVKDGFAGEVDPEQRRLLQMAYDSNERQLTIVDDLLYVARIDAGKATLRPEKLNINELIQSVIDDQLSVIISRKQVVSYRKPHTPVKFTGDPQYLRMIFENLLSNASKYSYQNTKISITLKVINDKVLISFGDKGVGIEPKDYSSVFFKFSRIPNELTRQIAGSGIGLYLAKQLAILHGGDITFTSRPKKGSTFIVELPMHK